jgi:hypothetical protein
MAEIEPGQGPAQQGVPERALLAGAQVGEQDGRTGRVGRGRQLSQPGRGQPPAEHAGQPGDRASRGQQVHLDA